MLTPESTVAAQYANSPTILALINGMNSAIDPSADIDKFYSDMFDISTAVGYGLDCWGRIVNVSRILTIPSAASTSVANYLGFAESGIGAFGFGWGTWSSPSGGSSNFILSDDAYRQLIMLKAAANIANCSISGINYILKQLFVGQGRAYVTDVGNMQLVLVFEFMLSPVQVAILLQSSIIPTPCGVGYNVMGIDIARTFGFSEAGVGASGFNSGLFFNGFATL
jgi:hypothetical protein